MAIFYLTYTFQTWSVLETYVSPRAHARTPCDLGFCMARLAGIIQLLLIVRDGVQKVHCVLEKDAAAYSAGHVQE